MQVMKQKQVSFLNDTSKYNRNAAVLRSVDKDKSRRVEVDEGVSIVENDRMAKEIFDKLKSE